MVLPIGDEDSPLDVNSDVSVVRCRDEDMGRRLHRAVTAASSDFVVLIATELWPVPGWLPPLVHMLHDRPDAGVASGVLVTPDGRVPVGVLSQNRAGGPPGEDPGSVGHSYVRRLQTAPGELFATVDSCSSTNATTGAGTPSLLLATAPSWRAMDSLFSHSPRALQSNRGRNPALPSGLPGGIRKWIGMPS